jgi:hypothetical protein
MAWTETFHCDVCNKEKSEESSDWWLAWTETVAAMPGEPELRAVKLTPWNNFSAHSSEMKHLCGARCVHTMLDRWMAAKG